MMSLASGIPEKLMNKKAYEIHIRKLSQIRTLRKNSLTAKRNLQIEHIKDQKHLNFMAKINEQAVKISNDNLKMFNKLTKETQSCRRPLSTRSTRTLSLDMSHSFQKKQQERKVHAQNQRLKSRINSSSSSMSYSRLQSSEKKRQQIKSRIRKYNEKDELKIDKYISNKSEYRTYQSESNNCSVSRPSNKKPNSVSFYNRREIIKNKIENLGILFKSKKNRPSTTEQHHKANPREHYKNASFFPTAHT